MSNSTPFLDQTPVFGEMLLSSSESTTQDLDALAVAVREIPTHELRSNLAVFLTLSISTFVVQKPNFGKRVISLTSNSKA